MICEKCNYRVCEYNIVKKNVCVFAFLYMFKIKKTNKKELNVLITYDQIS